MSVQASSPLFYFLSIKIILGPSDAWLMRRATQQPSILYWRLSDFLRILIKGSNLYAGSRSKYPCLVGLFLIWLVYNTDRFLRRYDFWLESFKQHNYMNLLPPYELLSYTGSKSKSLVWFNMEPFIKLPQFDIQVILFKKLSFFHQENTHLIQL